MPYMDKDEGPLEGSKITSISETYYQSSLYNHRIIFEFSILEVIEGVSFITLLLTLLFLIVFLNWTF